MNVDGRSSVFMMAQMMCEVGSGEVKSLKDNRYNVDD